MTWKQLCDKMARMIDSSSVDQKQVVMRYFSLANRELHREFEKNQNEGWAIIGASLGLEKRFESKFGPFTPLSEGIYLS